MLCEIATFRYGKGNKIPEARGVYPVYGCAGVVGSTDVYNNEDGPIIGHIGSAGKVVWGAGKHFVTYNGTIVVPNIGTNARYLYHLLCSLRLEDKVKGNQPFLSVSDYKKIKVPYPSLSIQKELADIIDRFDALCTDLTAGIPAEIAARKKQYEYYRDKLLSFE